MNEDLANIQYSPILDYKYARFFDEVQYYGKTLSDAERKELVVVIDDTIAQFSEGLPMLYDTLEKHAKSSSWWKEERNLETHMDTEKLYVSRQEEII